MSNAAESMPVSPTIQHRLHSDNAILDFVVDGKGEALGQQPVIPEFAGVYSAVDLQRIDISVQGI